MEPFSIFVKAKGSPVVYELSNRPRTASLRAIGSEGTLSALYYAGFGRSPIPPGFGTGITVAGVPVREVDPSFIADLLAA